MYINKVFLYGNLTRDPEMRALPNGGTVAQFSLATNRKYTNQGQEVEQTEYHSIVAFGKVSEVIGQYLKKGRPVWIEGRLQTRSWEKDGAKQYKTEIVLDSFQFGPHSGTSDRVEREDRGEDTDEKRSKAPEADKTYSSHMEGAVNYPEEVNPEDIPF